MTEHFHYDTNIELKLNTEQNPFDYVNIEEVLGIRFLIPAMVKIRDSSGAEFEVLAHFDLVNKTVKYDCAMYNKTESQQKAINFLNEMNNTLPFNTYEASDTVYSGIERAKSEQEEIEGSLMGDLDE